MHTVVKFRMSGIKKGSYVRSEKKKKYNRLRNQNDISLLQKKSWMLEDIWRNGFLGKEIIILEFYIQSNYQTNIRKRKGDFQIGKHTLKKVPPMHSFLGNYWKMWFSKAREEG